ncbi:MAG TPA: hypothetical protein VEZ51_00845, partial [Gemmatimonadaceae bacterium]|nr:hypothetical protein [Gemmatimonadaceae bacterium]
MSDVADRERGPDVKRWVVIATFFRRYGYFSIEMKRGYLLNSRSERRRRLLAILLVVIGQFGIVGAALTLA